MTEAATDVILARHRSQDGLSTMVTWSLVAHAVVLTVVWLAPSSPEERRVRPVMSISLGGAPGPRSGGLTQMGGRTVEAAPPAPVTTRRAEVPPAAPRPMAQPAPQPAKPVRARPTTAKASAQPATSDPPTAGSTRTDTRVRGQGFGLSSAGGGAGGPVQLDVTDFCCRDYLEQMIARIQSNWQQNFGVVGMTVVTFTVVRDGAIQDVHVERGSGFVALDTAADRAVKLTARVAPLPAQFPNPSLTVHMSFEYQR